jgi:hypothetical protein
LKVTKLAKNDQDMELIKEQLKVTQEQYAQMSKHIIELYNQLISNSAVTSDPETTLPIKEIAPKKEGTMKKATSLKDDTSK